MEQRSCLFFDEITKDLDSFETVSFEEKKTEIEWSHPYSVSG